MRYMPAPSYCDRTLGRRRDNSPFNIIDQVLWVMRGVDQTGRNEFQHGHEPWHERNSHPAHAINAD